MNTENRHRIQIHSWRVKLHYREEDRDQEFHFANEGLAMLAVEWAYAERLYAINNNRTDVESITEFEVRRNEDAGTYDRKLLWHKKAGDGRYYAMKDYFYYEQAVFEMEILYP